MERNIQQALTTFHELLKTHELTLNEFLVALFTSGPEVFGVYHRVKCFYGRSGPTKILKLWLSQKEVPKHEKASLSNYSTELAINLMEKEFKSLRKDETLQCSSGEVCHDMIEAFSMETFVDGFKSNAPVFHKVLTSLAGRSTHRNVSTIITTIGCMLLFLRCRSTSYLQMVLGLYLHSAGARRRVVTTLSNAGLSVSYDTILKAQKALSKDARKRVQEAVRTQPWFLIYDNINIPRPRSDQRIGNQDSHEGGTNATIVIGGGITASNIKDPYLMFNVEDLHPTKENLLHFRKSYAYHLIEALKLCCPSAGRFMNPAPSINRLPVAQTILHPLPTMRINESTVEGNKDILETVMEKVLELPAVYFEDGRQIIIAGDQMTISRLRSLMEQRRSDDSAYSRLEWMVPLIQLFHLQMLYSTTLIHNYYGTEGNPGIILSNRVLLRRKRVNLQKQDFHAADELLLHSFQALVMRQWEIEFGCDDIDKLNEKLRTFDNFTLNQKITSGAENIIRKFYDELQGSTDYTTSSKNAASFTRDMVLYLELSTAIKAGDIGRIEEALKWLTVIFQAGHTKNYAYELLHLHCTLHYASDQARKNAILASMLINTTGKPDRWIPADLYQEHNNLLTKVTHAVRASKSPWETLATSVSPNLHTFRKICSQVEEAFQIPVNSTKHTSVASRRDLDTLLTPIRDKCIFIPSNSNDPGVDPVKNLYMEGICKLQSLERTEAFTTKYRERDEPDAFND
ncbi:hypothetical protein BGX26_004899 [Mortierella sp. AD094]|nr:hypothetical protein BGX26_004899 [Mortierella sp. AD094]